MRDLRLSAMYWQISKQYLSDKPNVQRALVLLETRPDLVRQYEDELELAIDYYNDQRNSLGDELINAKELNEIYPADLPCLNEVLAELNQNQTLEQKVFTTLRDSNYFQQIWLIQNCENLLGNLMILVYRTTVLYSHSSQLINSDGSQRVQISSTLEEMLANLYLQGKKTRLFEAVKQWLQNWQEEGFSEKLIGSLLATQ